MSSFTHFDHNGQAQMVDVASKPVSLRRAVASGVIRMQPQTLKMVAEGQHKKGDVLGVARIAGIMASKRTADLVPLCHPIPLTKVQIDFAIDLGENLLRVQSITETEGKTGVEIEALNAVQVTLLTIYDMCKSIDRGMCIDSVQLLEKSGGTSGLWQAKSTTA